MNGVCMAASLIHMVFQRSFIEDMDVRPVAAALKRLVKDRDATIENAGSLVFSFDGWESDPRQAYQIPEIRAWFAMLTEMFPYWFVVCDRTGTTIPFIFLLLLPAKETQLTETGEIAVKHEIQDIQNLFIRLVTNFNELCDRNEISSELNATWTRDIYECYQAFSETR